MIQLHNKNYGKCIAHYETQTHEKQESLKYHKVITLFIVEKLILKTELKIRQPGTVSCINRPRM